MTTCVRAKRHGESASAATTRCGRTRAGSSPTLFANSPHPRDCDEHGVRADRRSRDGQGMELADFVNHPLAQTAHLQTAHVVALRLYSTAAFRALNEPLRDRQRTAPHPFAATIFFLADGIKKLRAVEADREARQQEAGGGGGKSIDLWRGMRNLEAASEFLKLGGDTLLHLLYLIPPGSLRRISHHVAYRLGAGAHVNHERPVDSTALRAECLVAALQNPYCP